MTDDGFYKNLLDNLFDGVYLADPERRITYWNTGAERLAGFPATQVVGTHCWDNKLLHVDGAGTQLCAAGCPLAATIEDGCPREAEVFMRHQLVWLKCRARPERSSFSRCSSACPW